ncbi:NADH-quinone oxidoreductase subunit J [Candidatus Eisenbacteria bacterium]|uniref:NADH-quinone oxidoreductase subunit J n=1 Tax=Eiseniibacteriota bacterium TaxID=2212470 RepID=A0ABV6YIU9_UNCEI
MLVFFFILFAVTSVLSALLVITRRSPVYAVLFLALTLCAQAGLFTLLGAFFIGVMQVVIYAGAILVLFLFVVLSLDPTESRGVLRRPAIRGASAVVVLLLAAQLIYALRESKMGQSPLKLSPGSGDTEHVAVLGKELFTTYLVPFEIGSVLLLVAVLGAVVLAYRKGKI